MLANKIHRKDYFVSKEVPSLVDITIDVVAKNFNLYPHLGGLKVQDSIDKIVEKTSPEWPLTITAPNIPHESYWKRACDHRYKNLRPNDHGWSWKQTYLETYLQEMLSKHPGTDLTDFLELLVACKQFVFNLDIEEMPSHMDMRVLFRNIPCITRLRITYGAKHLGSEYDSSMFGMLMDDAASLSKCIKNSQCLVSLSLPCNLIDDDLVKMLVGGLLLNKTLVELDLSHNRIGNNGARRIGKYLFHTEVLSHLNLEDNVIEYEGSRCIGQALRNNSSLSYLNLKHNRIEDKAGAKFWVDLHSNQTLKTLNLGANMLSQLSCEKLVEFLDREECFLRHLDIGSNALVDEEAEETIREDMVKSVEKLKEVLSKKCPLLKLEIRNNGLPKSLEKEISETVVKNELDKRNIPLFTSKPKVSRQSSVKSEPKEEA